MDQESGIRAACLSAFADEIKAHKDDIPKPDEDGVRLIMLKEEIAAQRKVGTFEDVKG